MKKTCGSTKSEIDSLFQLFRLKKIYVHCAGRKMLTNSASIRRNIKYIEFICPPTAQLLNRFCKYLFPWLYPCLLNCI